MGAGTISSPLTPTAWANMGVEKRVAAPMPIGPSGLPIPRAGALFRKTLDLRVLADLVRAAAKAERGSRLWQSRASATAALRADLLERFPPADMTVLERYGVGQTVSWVIVNPCTPEHSPSWQAALPEPVTLPIGTHQYGVDLGGRTHDYLPAPPEVIVFIKEMIALRAAQDGWRVRTWVEEQRKLTGRWPLWRQIEAQYPALGDFIARERAAIEEQAA